MHRQHSQIMAPLKPAYVDGTLIHSSQQEAIQIFLDHVNLVKLSMQLTIIQKSVSPHGCTNNLYREWVQDIHILQINIHQFSSSLQCKERWSSNVHKTIPKLMCGDSGIYQKEIISIKNTLQNNNYPGYKFN